MKKKKLNYDSSNIETLSFPSSIRDNVSMYLGSSDSYGIFTSIRECLDNAVDEFKAGRNTSVHLHFDNDGSYWIFDKGEGIPQGVQKIDTNINGKIVTHKMPTLQAVFGVLHTSGKFKTDAYQTSLGTHGVGAKGTNATSEFFRVYTCFKNKWYHIEFKKGILTTPVTEIGKAPSTPIGRIEKGTVIHVKPDFNLFSEKSFSPKMVSEWAETMAYLNAGLTISLSRKNKQTGKLQGTKYHSKDGVKDYIKARLQKLEVEAEPSIFEFSNELADIAIAFSTYDDSDIRGFTNGLHNAQGGKHVDSISRALFSAIQPFKGKKQDFNRRDFEEGLLGVVNAKLHKASFSSQDKAKLSDDRMGSDFEKTLTEAATTFFRKNKSLASRLCEKSEKLAGLRSKFKADKQLINRINKVKKGLPASYAPPSSKVPVEQRELFLVEGDSAAGNLKRVRRQNQGVLPLRGKVLNVSKMKEGKSLTNRAVLDILACINYDFKAVSPVDKINVGKIICVADADPDGKHITSLLLSVFYTLAPDLFDRGLVYIGVTPKYIAKNKNQVYTGQTRDEILTKLEKDNLKNISPTYLKGLGGLNPNETEVFIVDESSRQLMKIKPVTEASGIRFKRIMGRSASDRREELSITTSDD